MKLYFKYMKILMRSQMQYRSSFLMVALGQLIYPFPLYAGVVLLVGRFGEIGGWTVPELTFCFGSLLISYSIAEAFARGFDLFSHMVRTGGFDRVLVRPRSTILQVLGSRFELNRAGKLAGSLGLYIWAAANLDILWSIDKVAVAFFMAAAGVFVFSGIFVLAGVWSFWTISGNELLNILTDGTREMARFPLDVYKSKIILLFVFVVPIASANFLPLLYITGKALENRLLYAFSPLLGLLFIFPCLLLWKTGVRHYKSTGS
ncbi:MAG: ABC-2 family transporter protein [Clostridia bacterium]|nr:ABC-2 family transporter protein [Clostridia bacterium]